MCLCSTGDPEWSVFFISLCTSPAIYDWNYNLKKTSWFDLSSQNLLNFWNECPSEGRLFHWVFKLGTAFCRNWSVAAGIVLLKSKIQELILDHVFLNSSVLRNLSRPFSEDCEDATSRLWPWQKLIHSFAQHLICTMAQCAMPHLKSIGWWWDTAENITPWLSLMQPCCSKNQNPTLEPHPNNTGDFMVPLMVIGTSILLYLDSELQCLDCVPFVHVTALGLTPWSPCG